MFKIVVLCTLLVTIRGLPTHHQGVDIVPAPVENDSKPQPFTVPVEQVLKASVSQSKDEEVVDPTPLKATVADVPVDTAQNHLAVETHEVDPDKDRTLLLILAAKLTTVAPTTIDPAIAAAAAAAAAAGKR